MMRINCRPFEIGSGKTICPQWVSLRLSKSECLIRMFKFDVNSQNPLGEITEEEDGVRFQAFAALDPASATAWKSVGDALEASGRSAEAREAYQNALHAQELDPVFQEGLIAELQKKLNP